MRRLRTVPFLAFALLLISAAALAAPPTVDEDLGRACGTVETGPQMLAPDEATIEKWIKEHRIAAGGVIPVNIHVIYGRNNEGNVPESQLDRQIAVLNSTFAGRGYNNGSQTGDNTGYTFTKNSVTRTYNRTWFTMTIGSSRESQAKNALVVNPKGSLNLYTCKPGQSLLGWATFPWSLAGNPNMDGVVIHYASLPGGTLAPYNLGGTGTHEVGHWIGLYHTFQGGCNSDATCSSAGDLVCDTPAQGTPTSGCPSSKNTCNGAGNDPVHNYMDYSTDACYTQFTAGQDSRADFMMGTYRPLIGSAPAKSTPDASSPEIARTATLRAAPNPFNPTTEIEFALPRSGHVSLRILDVAGREVARLVDGVQDAGAHRAVFEARNVPSGVYVAVLRGAGIELTERLVLLK